MSIEHFSYVHWPHTYHLLPLESLRPFLAHLLARSKGKACGLPSGHVGGEFVKQPTATIFLTSPLFFQGFKFLSPLSCQVTVALSSSGVSLGSKKRVAEPQEDVPGETTQVCPRLIHRTCYLILKTFACDTNLNPFYRR